MRIEKAAAGTAPGHAVAGKVWLVGAGPGDPELLTLKAVRALGEADVVAYDELVSEAVLAMAPPHAERIPVGRRAGGVCHNDKRIHPVVIERARAGLRVVRLKGGDPFVFGRGGEEAEELRGAGVPFEVVPGISAALGAAASSGIPLTHRDASSSVTLATAHLADIAEGTEGAPGLPAAGTLVFYMGMGRLEATCKALVARGRAATTPAAIVSRATLPDQRVLVGTLETLPALAAAAALPTPALLVVGEVVDHRVAPAAAARAVAPLPKAPASYAVPTLFPAFLKVGERTILVVGAGAIAEKKIQELLDAGARVRVVAPRCTPAVEALAASGRVTYEARPFTETDVEGAWFVIAATDDGACQARVYKETERRRIFTIAIDDPANGSAFCGAVVRKAPFLVAISSSGAAPALSRLLREMLDAFLPDDRWVQEAQAMRVRWRSDGVPMHERFGDLVRRFAGSSFPPAKTRPPTPALPVRGAVQESVT